MEKFRSPSSFKTGNQKPHLSFKTRMEDFIARMQDDKSGIPIRTVKSFLSKIPSVFSGSDIVQWMIKNLNIEDQVEALHLGTLMAAHGYFFPISDHVLTLKDDGTFYRFQTPYFWPSNCWEPENTDYAVYLCKRTMQNKARLELADYEAESLARLQRAFARKWEFIFMQAEAQAKVDKKRDKIERKILDSQERAFWDVHRPVVSVVFLLLILILIILILIIVLILILILIIIILIIIIVIVIVIAIVLRMRRYTPGCVNTTEVDIKKSSRMKNPHKTRKSVYGLQNDVRSHSPTHTPAPEAKQPTEEELQEQITFWQVQLDRHRLKMSKVAESLLGYTEQYVEYDPFLTPSDPSNPWITDDNTIWELEASKEPGQQRVKRWAFGIDEVLKDPIGREQFLKFLESEFSSENLRFWLAVQELKKRPIREVPSRVQEIWQEFLASGAPSAINVDSKSYAKTTQNVKDPGRYAFEDAQEHIYKLMKSDSYSRFIRSSAYQELLQAKKKPRTRRCGTGFLEEPLIQTTSHSTPRFLGSSAIRPPSVTAVG
ncbi:Regulator of G-protein signaling 7 [Merluccius polli]|uniref:Regulator of G-protein signaling 7 n=1 Tax=Merluccius polli TaxID=89951 RepID=A0AA47NRY0_MERPO|nr:Regulator of G-protein signaling 7 [Merluccius polli]